MGPSHSWGIYPNDPNTFHWAPLSNTTTLEVKFQYELCGAKQTISNHNTWILYTIRDKEIIGQVEKIEF